MRGRLDCGACLLPLLFYLFLYFVFIIFLFRFGSFQIRHLVIRIGFFTGMSKKTRHEDMVKMEFLGSIPLCEPLART